MPLSKASKDANKSNGQPSNSKDQKNSVPPNEKAPSFTPVPTRMTGIGNMARTQFEGMMPPQSYNQEAYQLTVAASKNKDPQSQKGASKFEGKSKGVSFKLPPGASGSAGKAPPPPMKAPSRQPTGAPGKSKGVSLKTPSGASGSGGKLPPPPLAAPSMRPMSQKPLSNFASKFLGGQQPLPGSPLGPIRTASIHVTPQAIQMASQQPKMSTMPASQRAQQEQWAQSVLPSLVRDFCPEGNRFFRVDIQTCRFTISGYQCQGGRHFVSDELIASGVVGLFFLLDPNDPTYQAGPYYPSEEFPGMLFYSGVHPKQPPHAPDYLEGDEKGNLTTSGEKTRIAIGRTMLKMATERDLLDIARWKGMEVSSGEEARKQLENYIVAKESGNAPANKSGGKSGNKSGGKSAEKSEKKPKK